MAQVVHIPLLRRHPEVNLVAICDLDSKKAALVAQKNKVTHFFSDVELFLKLDELDAVFVCTPTNSHMAFSLAALSAGKHVLVEQPVARTHAEAMRMVKAATDAKRTLMVAMNHRFRPDSMILRNFLEANELGKIVRVRAGWLKKQHIWTRPPWVMNPKISGGGVLMDIGLQMLDISLWILGNPKVEKVSATSSKILAGRKVEDTVFAFYRLRGGTSLTVDVSWSMMAEESVAYTLFYGKQGSAELNPLKITKEMHGNLVNVTPGKSHTSLDLYKKSFEFEVDHFVQSVLHKRKTMSSIEDAASVMAIIEATYKSITDGQEITMAES